MTAWQAAEIRSLCNIHTIQPIDKADDRRQTLDRPIADAGFRTVQWHEQEVSFLDGKIIGEFTPAERPPRFFGELDYEIDGLPYHMSTQVWMTE